MTTTELREPFVLRWPGDTASDQLHARVNSRILVTRTEHSAIERAAELLDSHTDAGTITPWLRDFVSRWRCVERDLTSTSHDGSDWCGGLG